MGSTASGGWENYHVAGEHICIFTDWMRISDSWVLDNWEFTVHVCVGTRQSKHPPQ
jgi:hypothetical protein